MSREIKFRVWDKESGKYRDQVPAVEEYWDSDCWDDPEEHMSDMAYISLDVGSQFSHRLIWEQYTGLKDKNGKEIYEGDIVRITEYQKVSHPNPPKEWISWCWFNEETARYGFGQARTWQGAPKSHCWTTDDHVFFEIIGNIHENPELLK